MRPCAQQGPIRWEEQWQLPRALESVERMALVGLTERYTEFIVALARRYVRTGMCVCKHAVHMR